MYRGAIGASIGGQICKEESSRFGASGKGVELGRNLGHELGNHLVRRELGAR